MGMAFIDLQAQRRRIGERMTVAMLDVLEGGQYVLGPQVGAFENRLAAFGQARHALCCANGTDALALAMTAFGIGPGDAVFCPSFSFVATAEIVPWFGASPVFVDILPETFNIDPHSLELAIEAILAGGRLHPKAVIAVDLFGQPADYPALCAITKKYGMKLIADSAQGFGCTLNGRHPVHWADVATTSFYPAKPLGCYGDGGAILTNSDDTAAIITSLRNHGAGADRYDNVRIGMNSRLDTLQAAVLIEKLAIFADEIDSRNAVARRYGQALGNVVSRVPHVIDGGVSVWAQYTIEVQDRAALAEHLRARGIPTAVHYPKPIHRQSAYRDFAVGAGGLAVCEAKAQNVISLPMHPYLSDEDISRVTDAIRAFYT